MEIYNLIDKAIDELGFTIVEYNNLRALIKPRKYNLSIILDISYNFTKKEIKEIESSKNGYEIVKKETKRLISRSFDPTYYYKTIYDDETDEYMKNNGYFLALRLNILDDYIRTF